MQQCGQMFAMGIPNLPRMLALERRMTMFQNNASYLEKLAYTKQAEIMHEIQGRNRYDLREQYDVPIEPQRKYNVRVFLGMLVLLGWLFSLIV
jgi:hypothetical protein